MFLYTLKRLGLIVPTLLVISLLTFGLNQCTPGDPVDARMPANSTGKNPLDTWQLYQQNYRIAAQAIGKDLPLFYCSLSTQAYPDSLHCLQPLAERQNAQRLIGRYGNWPDIQAYLIALRAATTQVLRFQGQHNSDPLIATTKALQALTGTHEPTAIDRTFTKLTESIGQDSLLQATFMPYYEQLTATYASVQTNKSTWLHYLPALHWHGTANQYHHWLARVARGDLGKSLTSAQAVSEKIRKAIKWTLQLNGMAILLAYLLAIPLGVYSAIWAGSRFDRWLSICLFLLFAIPSFWTATLLSKFLTTQEWLDLFPSMGVGELAADASWWTVLTTRSHHFFLPIFCMTYGSLAYLTRQVRANMLGVLQSDFVRTARAKGLLERQVIWRHAFPNALFPLITMFASVLPRAIAGSVIIEQIFNIPGIGKLTIDSIYGADWPIVYGLLLLTAVLTTIGILLSDLLYAWADPRVELQSSKTTAHV